MTAVSSQLSPVKFAQREPLTTRLRGLIRDYPKGVGLVHEFIQNADDAGAQSIQVVLDERSYPGRLLPSAEMVALQGPALVVVNDAEFSEEDWQRIQTIGESGKAMDTSKTGRFGHGFNSVYNVTDLPCILSGSKLGFFDPHVQNLAGTFAQDAGAAWDLDQAMWSQSPDLLATFEAFGLTHGTTHFPGTIFRLPLRSDEQAKRSLICNQPFTRKDYDAIVEKLRGRVGELLLFLTSLTTIEFRRIDPSGQEHRILAAQTANSEVVVDARAGVLGISLSDHQTLLDQLARPNASSTVSEFMHEIEIYDADTKLRHEHWFVVQGIFSDKNNAVVDCAREMFVLGEKAIPLAGAAALLSPTSVEKPQGRFFCGLPLPVPSTLADCHINGFFDLQTDRQGLFEDPGAEGSSAVRVRWNRVLMEHCCAEAAARLCVRLARHALDANKKPYERWPHVPEKERSIVDELPRHTYGRLREHDCVAAGGNSVWRRPADTLVPLRSANELVRAALLADSFPIPHPELPNHVTAGFHRGGCGLPILSAGGLRSELRLDEDPKCALEEAPRPCLTRPEWVRSLLVYGTLDKDLEDLVGVPLALMADGRLRAFGLVQGFKICLAGPKERELYATIPAWFLDSRLEDATALRESSSLGVMQFTPELVVLNLPKVLPEVDEQSRVKWMTGGERVPTEEWLSLLFGYMATHAGEIKLDQDHVKKLPIVPDQFGFLHGMGLPSTPLLAPSRERKPLVEALRALGVPLVTGSEELLKSIRGFVDKFPDVAICPLAPRDLIDTLDAVAEDGPGRDGRFNMKTHGAVLDYFATRGLRALEGEASDRIDKLRGLRIFPSTTGKVVPLDVTDYYIPRNYERPEVDVELAFLDCGPEQSWAALYRVLRVQTLTRARLLSDVLLPKFRNLGDDEQLRTLQWIRHNLYDVREEEEDEEAGRQCLEQLGSGLLVRCSDGKPRPPRSLYHPDAEIVTDLLGDAVGFPDKSLYSDRPELWLEFFETVGMARTPRADDILATINDSTAPTADNADAIQRLVKIAEYVDKHWEGLRNELVPVVPQQPSDTDKVHLSDALSHRAWLPALRSPPLSYPTDLLKGHPTVLFKPSDLYTRNSLDLIGSVRPVCAVQGLRNMRSSIGLSAEPPLEDVLKHLDHVLASAIAIDTNAVSQDHEHILHQIYEHLGRALSIGDCDDEADDRTLTVIRNRYCDRECLVDEERRLWAPRHSFGQPVPFFLGRRVCIRSGKGMLERGLTVLGRRDSPAANDFRRFFAELADDYTDSQVPDEELDQLRSAYQRAAAVATDDELTESPVLAKDGTFVAGEDVVLDNAPWLSARAIASGMRLLDSQLGPDVAKAFGVRFLSSAVYEKPYAERPSQDAEFLRLCQGLQNVLRSPELTAGVHRLLHAFESGVSETDISTFFTDLRVLGVGNLKSVLVRMDDDMPVEGSIGSCDTLFDPGRNAVVVSEDAADVIYDRVADVLGVELGADGNGLGEGISKFIAILRVAPGRIEEHLTKLHVPLLHAATGISDLVIDDKSGYIDDDTAEGDSGEKENEGERLETEAGTPSSGTETADLPDDRTASADSEPPERETEQGSKGIGDDCGATSVSKTEDDSGSGGDEQTDAGGQVSREVGDESGSEHSKTHDGDAGPETRGGKRNKHNVQLHGSTVPVNMSDCSSPLPIYQNGRALAWLGASTRTVSLRA